MCVLALFEHSEERLLAFRRKPRCCTGDFSCSTFTCCDLRVQLRDDVKNLLVRHLRMWIALRLLPSLCAFSDALSMLLLLFERRTPIVAFQGAAKPAGRVLDAMPFLGVTKNRELFQHGVRAEELSESPRTFLVDAVPFASMEIFSLFSSAAAMDVLISSRTRVRVSSPSRSMAAAAVVFVVVFAVVFSRAREERPSALAASGFAVSSSMWPFWPLPSGHFGHMHSTL